MLDVGAYYSALAGGASAEDFKNQIDINCHYSRQMSHMSHRRCYTLQLIASCHGMGIRRFSVPNRLLIFVSNGPSGGQIMLIAIMLALWRMYR